MMNPNQILQGHCGDLMKDIETSQIDLVYFDPPFFTQKAHTLSDRFTAKTYAFSDRFDSLGEYLSLIEETLVQSKRVLKETGSVFLHCDRTASHHIRIVLDKVFGEQNFQSEIVWSYKRWSNAKKGLLNSHQIIFFYSKTANFKFNPIYTDYSPTTNLDQILQERERNGNGKSAYKKDDNGHIVIGKEKKGVPLADVWDIPYLNPKARERTGYPTQKPVLLLNQIIRIATDEGDLVLDPFCGSGTTCVSAKLLGRSYLGFDISKEAVELAEQRLNEMIISDSNLVNKGIDDYLEKTEKEIALLTEINAFPVQRNSGIDGFLREHFQGKPVPVKIQGEGEPLEESIRKLQRASVGRQYLMKIVIQTNKSEARPLFDLETDVLVIKSLGLQAEELKQRAASGH